jgi:hypothetical protein
MSIKSPDKLLIAIVAGVILLVIISFIVVLRQPEPVYLAEDTPEGVIHNYLLALQNEDYERAYGYLSPNLAGYPTTPATFASDVSQNAWQFGQDGSDSAFEISGSKNYGKETIVDVTFTSFNRGGLFGSNSYTETTQFTLANESDGWRIVHGNYRFWVQCWDEPTLCK